METIPITMVKSTSIFHCPSAKSQGTLAFHLGFPHKGNSNKNVKKKEHNVDQKKVFQAHAAQIQTLQNELKSSRAQLVNIKGKSSQPASHTQLVQGSRSWKGPPRSFYGLSHDAMVAEYVFSSTHNSSFTLEFALPTSRHKRLVWHPKFLPLGR
jgi:hypothetical protein